METNQANKSINNTTLVIIFTTIAFILAWWGFCWYTNRPLFGFDKAQRFCVLFKDINGLNNDGNVRMDGIRIGAIEKIEWLAPKQVKVHLKIFSKQYSIYSGVRASIHTNGLIGAKYVDLVMPVDALAQNEEPKLLDEHSTITAEEPANIELAMEKVAHLIDDFDPKQFGSQWRSDRHSVVQAADRLTLLADKTMPLVERAIPMENEVTALSKDLRQTLKRLNGFLGNEHVATDLKDTAQKAKETAEDIQAAIHELNGIVADKALRGDIISSFTNLNEAMLHLENSLDVLHETANNPGLRSDIKQILSDTRHTMDSVDKVISKPEFGSNLRLTLERTREAVDNINIAAKQINQILDKRHPLIHMFIGRPGHIKTEEVDKIEYKNP